MKINRTRLISRETNVRDAWLCVIATEGAQTEAQYFEMFQSHRVKVLVLPTGDDGCSSPQAVFTRLDVFKDAYDLGEEDQLWLMVDVDRWHHLPETCKRAKQEGVRLAVSNPCFELWPYLHHADAEAIDTDCKAVEDRLRARLGQYNKSRLVLDGYRPGIADAIRRAKALDTNPTELWPSSHGTHVYKVVESLPQPAI